MNVQHDQDHSKQTNEDIQPQIIKFDNQEEQLQNQEITSQQFKQQYISFQEFENNKSQSSDDEDLKQINLNQDKGIVGLKNLSNTSYMNSTIQCLSNVQPLTHYFLRLNYMEEINESNPLGTKGQLVEQYGSLLKQMWCGNSRVVDPSSFKKLVEKINPVFQGYQTNDSSEFITFLLDGIHEDLNKIKKKPYVEEPDSNGRLDFEVAKESWINHTARNQSIIYDLMFGQYKRSFECPECKKVSLKYLFLSYRFDPYLTVELNIPDNKKKFIELLYHDDFSHFKRKFIPFSQSQTYKLKELKAKMQIECDLRGKELLFYIQIDNSTYQILDEGMLVNEVKTLSDISGLNVRELADFEAIIPRNDRIFIQFDNEVIQNNGQRRSLKQGGFLVFGIQFSLKQVHLKVFKMLKHLFEKVLEGIGFQNDDELLTFYIQNVMQKFYQLSFKSNKSFLQSCSFCNREQFDCQVDFTDDRISDIKIQKLDPNRDIKLVVSWLSSPQKNVQISDLFDLAQQNALTQEQLKEQREKHHTLKLEDCLQFSQLPRQLKNEDLWYCKNCQIHVNGFMSSKIYKAPKILILKLRRFKTSKRILKQISGSFVDFPINGLDMSHIMNSCIPNDYVVENIQDNGEIRKKPILYDLFAIINYFGGHCTAYAKNHILNKWYNFDDSNVSEIKNVDQIVSKAAYMLFYKLREDNTEHQKSI